MLSGFVLGNAAGLADRAQGLISCQRGLLLSSCGHPLGLLQPGAGEGGAGGEAGVPWVKTKVKISGRKNKAKQQFPPEEKPHLTVGNTALSLSAQCSLKFQILVQIGMVFLP